jgi:hypothetical protein
VLDGAHVGIAAAEKYVVEDGLFGTGAFDGFMDVVDLEIQLSIHKPKMGERSKVCSGAASLECGVDLRLA